jgi:hypothetical protein
VVLIDGSMLLNPAVVEQSSHIQHEIDIVQDEGQVVLLQPSRLVALEEVVCE